MKQRSTLLRQSWNFVVTLTALGVCVITAIAADSTRQGRAIVPALNDSVIVKTSSLRYDTLIIAAGAYLQVGDSVLIVPADTVLILPDTLRVEILENTGANRAAHYDSLRSLTGGNWITRSLFDLLFAPPPNNADTGAGRVQRSERVFLPFEGKYIRYIELRKLDAIGTSVTDTTRRSSSWLARAGNSLHFTTRDPVLRANLLIRSGDRLHPYVLADNERILRDLPYVEDARIHVRPVPEHSDSVDVLVITKDLWSIGVDLKFRGLNGYIFELFDFNFLGLGHNLDLEFLFDPDKTPSTGFEAAYTIDNIGGSFISLEGLYADNYERKVTQIQASRRFFAPGARIAGGARYGRTLTYVDQDDTTGAIINDEVDEHDIWLGRAFPLESGIDPARSRSSIVLAGRMQRRSFLHRPEVRRDTNFRFHNGALFLGGITFNNRNYYKGRLIYGFGRTEDIPYGHRLETLFGWENAEFFNRFYLGGSYRFGDYIGPLGYLSAFVSAGGYLREREFEHGVLKGGGSYFSQLISLGDYRLRQFVSGEYSRGINDSGEEEVDFDDDNVLRGIVESKEIRADELLKINAETVLFTPWSLYGFHFALFGFADLGFVALNEEFVTIDNLYSGLGFGMRIRNESLVFQTFQFRFAFYSSLPPGFESKFIRFSSEKLLNLDDFAARAPQTVEFD